MKLAPNTLHTVPFECTCGTVHNTGDGKLPVGWTTRGGQTWCGDCTRLGIPTRELPVTRSRTSARRRA